MNESAAFELRRRSSDHPQPEHPVGNPVSDALPRRGYSLGVSARMIAAVLLPLGLVFAFAASNLRERYADTARARDLQADVIVLVDLVELDSALLTERLLAIPPLGAEQPFVSGDPLLESARLVTNGRLELVAGDNRPFRQADLDRLRQLQDSGASTDISVASRFDELSTDIRIELDQVTQEIHNLAVATRNVRLTQSIDQLDESSRASSALLALSLRLTAYWNAAPFEEAITRSDLARTAQDFDRASEWLDANAVDGVRTDWLDLASTRSLILGLVDDALKGLSHPVSARRSDGRIVISVLLDAAEIRSFVAMTPMAAADVERESGQVFEAADADARWGVALWLGILLFSSLIVLRLTRSILVPLHQITDHAREVGSGNLDVEPLRDDGPAELKDAARSINDLVANLQLMDKKAQALAAFRLDDPVLFEPLPGNLGRALNESVHILSGSMVERERLQTRLAHDATHDMLTGIPNRAAALAHLEAACNRANRLGHELAIAFIDLDDFKRINDTHGHPTGDEVLRQASERMTSLIREEDMVARLGGDEFLLVAEGIEGTEAAVGLARRLVEVLRQPMVAEGTELELGASVGVALVHNREDMQGLLRQADLAVYAAKASGTGSVQVFDDTLRDQLLERIEIEEALKTALLDDGLADLGADPDGNGAQTATEFHLVYQPILSSDGGDLVSMEALLRWERPEQGFVPPDRFIPIAEQTSLILDIDRWVLRQALRQLSEWQSVPWLAGISMAVNVSGRHVLDSNFVSDIGQALDTSGVDPTLVVIEVTETVLVDDLARAANQLGCIREFGVRVAVDDFGTGYTSLAHLRSLPIDKIKIDRSFVTNLASDADDRSLVRMVSELASHLGVPTVAEGVETVEQHQILRELGCDTLQGYLFSRPLRPEQLVSWARTHTSSGEAALT